MTRAGLLAWSVDDLTLFAGAFDRRRAEVEPLSLGLRVAAWLADAATLNVESFHEQA